jgi:hypothetical protein
VNEGMSDFDRNGLSRGCLLSHKRGTQGALDKDLSNVISYMACLSGLRLE